MSYEKVPDGMSFSTEFDTYIIAYCPDQCEWFVTNHELRLSEYRPSFASGKVSRYFRRQQTRFSMLRLSMIDETEVLYERK